MQHTHILVCEPPIAGFTLAQVERNGSGTFTARFGIYSGFSTNNSMQMEMTDIGSESTSNSAHSYSALNFLSWKSTGPYVGGWAPGTISPPVQESPQTFSWTTFANAAFAGIPC